MKEPEAPIQFEREASGKVNIIMDMSNFDLFELCQMRYHIRHNLLRAERGKAPALDRGALAHEGLEVYYNLLKEDKHYNDRMQACLMRIKMLSSDPEFSDLDPDEVPHLLSAVEQSCDYWRFEDEQLRILEVESPFMYLLYEDEFVRILITGKIDLLIDRHIAGSTTHYVNLPMDHKTFQRDFEVPRLSNQFMNYCCAVGSNYLIVNRIGLHIGKTLKPEDKFKRNMLSYDPIILQEWKDNLKNVILDEYLQCVGTQRWKMNFTSCFKFNRKCEYYEICESSGQEAKQHKLETSLVPASPWDVTATLNKNKEKK